MGGGWVGAGRPLAPRIPLRVSRNPKIPLVFSPTPECAQTFDVRTLFPVVNEIDRETMTQHSSQVVYYP